ncbi:AAA family ATPase [Psychrobacter sp. I-STPA6b]|uniref:AAA family ATPase n=1 Tax=Psychrobacter sp. I-STPA6b TaxID=2585718 RepID=UPI001D0C1C8E|nr:AAA family ATPase [Psychrobacter sp. I-STPA6b]
MKILESKYYRPRMLLQFEEYGNTIHAVADKDMYRQSNNPFAYLLSDLLPKIYLSGEKIVINKEQLQDFTECTDFYTVEYSAEYNICYQEERCFYHPTLHIFIVTEEDLSDEYGRDMFNQNVLRVNNVYYDSTNPKSLESVKYFFDEYLQKYVSNEAKVSILLKERHGFVFKTQRIKPLTINLDTMYNDDFLPVHQHIKSQLTDSKKGLVLLHGIAGSGKTNYIKWLTSQVPSKQFIFVPTNMIGYLTDPEMMSMLVDNKNSVLVLEDCENYISERSSGDLNTDVVSTILNIADGMLSDILECQFICTFNADISRIDSALLRQGRLIAEYKFKELDIKKANAYLKSHDIDKTVDKPMSLAELTNIDNASYKEQVKEKKIGFL